MNPQQPNQQPQGYPSTPPQNGAVPPYPPQAPQQPQYQPQPEYQQPYPQQQAPQMPPVQQPSPWEQQAAQTTPFQQPAQQPQPQLLPQPTQPLTPDGMASIDYLNKISTPQKRGLALSRTQILIVGAVLIVVTIVVMILALMNSGGPSMAAQSQHLVARTSALVDTTKKSQKNIKSRDLSVLNSSLTVQMTSAQTTLTEVLGKQGLNVTKIDKKVTAAESNSALLDKLNDAHLSGIFDRVYSREMSYELQKMLINVKKFYAASSSAETKGQFESIYNNLEPLQKQLAEFNGATS